MKAEIVCVGRELLIGETLNTNATFLSKELTKLGLEVQHHTTIGDEETLVINATLNAISRSDVVIFTGGLGPTMDDLTKESVAKALGDELIQDDNILEDILEKFLHYGNKMTKNNIKQALVPKGGRPLKNDKGTAPGIVINKDGRMIFLLPGPPNEMKHVFESGVKPLLMDVCEYVIENKIIKTISIGESKLEDIISGVINNYNSLTIATYAKGGKVDIHVSYRSKNKVEAKKMVEKAVSEIECLIGDYIYSYDDKDIEEIVYKLLLEKNKMIGFCESCTGGLISSRLTKLSGVSAVFDRGIVSYSNEAKVQELGVSSKTLEKYGAVSEETAIEMAKGLLERKNIDISISVTGIAGPEGGTKEKPVGLVYIAIGSKYGIEAYKYNFIGSREKIQNRAANVAFDLVRKYLINLN